MPTHHEDTLTQWISEVVIARGGEVGELNFIFCDDSYLHSVNVEYLQHDTLTDIITFPYADFPQVTGDLFVSTERVRDNAAEFGERYADELHRVMIHGVLHLCGQGDKTEEDTAAMRELENWALARRPPELLS